MIRYIFFTFVAVGMTACTGSTHYDRFKYHTVQSARMSNDAVVTSLERPRLCPRGQVSVEDYSEIEQDSELEVEMENNGLYWLPHMEFESETEGRRNTRCVTIFGSPAESIFFRD